MKKKLYSLIAILFTVALCVFCDNKNNDSEVIKYNFNGENLNIKYSDEVMNSKSVDMKIENNTVTITLNGVIPGNENTILTPVEIKGSLTQFTFSGEANVKNTNINFSGGVKEGVCSINLDVKMSNLDLVNKWYYNNNIDENIFPVMITWKTKSGKIELFPGTEMQMEDLTEMANPLISAFISENTTYLEFFGDGNIAMDLTQVGIVSPKNIIMYSIPESGKLVIDIDESAVNSVDLTPEMSMLISLLFSNLDVNYAITSNALKITIPEQKLKPILNSIDIIVLMLEQTLQTDEDKELLKQIAPGIKKAAAETTEIYIDINLLSEKNK